MKKNNSKTWKFIDGYTVTEYSCGLKSGQSLILRKDLPITSHDGTPTGAVHTKGEKWVVLPGSEEDPGTVWLQEPSGSRHTWDDSIEIFEWFEACE